MDRIEIIEHVTLPGPVCEGLGEGVYVGDQIDALGVPGVTQELYHVVLDAPAGRGGKVNLNGRLYVPEEVREQHEKLARRAPKAFVVGEKGHPPPGGATWDIAMRLVGGAVREEADGATTAIGRFGILKTSHGSDVHLLWRAGMQIGLSHRALVRVSEETIQEGTRWGKLNPEHIGRKVEVCTDLLLRGYDAVLQASAGTNMPAIEGAPTSEDVGRALQAVYEAGILPPDPVQETEENTMPLTLKDLLEQAPDLVADIRREATEAAKTQNPLADLSADDRELVALAVEHVAKAKKGAPAEYQRALSAVTEQAQTDRKRLALVEGENGTLRTQIAEQGAALAQIKAELAGEKLRREVIEQITAKATAAGHDSRIRDHILAQVAKGKVVSVEEAVGLYDEIAMLTQAAAPVAPLPSAGGSRQTATEGVAPAAVPAPEMPPAPGALAANPMKDRAAAIASRIRHK